MSNPRATLMLMCGLPGAGKTTLAKLLESRRRAVRLTPDEWMESIVRDGYDEERRAAVEAVQWKLAERLLTLGVSVILDWGFWSRSERDDYRQRAADLGAACEIWYPDLSLAALKARLADRNTDLPPSTFAVAPELLETWAGMFDAPSEDEPDVIRIAQDSER